MANLNGKILVVEDEEALRDIVIEILSDAGFDCLGAENGQKAIDNLIGPIGQDVNMVLSDIKMPVLDGLTMIRILREKGVEVPVVFLSAFGDKEKAIEALKWGAFDFLDKPIERPKLIKTVTAAVELGKKLRSIETQIDDFLNLTSSNSSEAIEKRDNLKSLILGKVEIDLRFSKGQKSG